MLLALVSCATLRSILACVGKIFGPKIDFELSFRNVTNIKVTLPGRYGRQETVVVDGVKDAVDEEWKRVVNLVRFRRKAGMSAGMGDAMGLGECSRITNVTVDLREI